MPEFGHDVYTDRWVGVLDHGQHVQPHAHPYHQLNFASDGVLSVTTLSGTWVAPSNRAIWIPAVTIHEHRAHGRTVMRSIGFGTLEAPLARDRPAVVSVLPLLRELLIAYTGDDTMSDAERSRMRSVIADRIRNAPEQPLHLPRPRDDRLVSACALVEQDLTQSRSMAELAAATHTSVRSLTRLFQEDMGMSYPQWRTQLRLYHALLLLSSGESVTAVGHACGWSSTSSFIDAFRSIFGQTPGNATRPLHHVRAHQASGTNR